MDAFSLIRTLGALTLLLGMLSAALWAVKRYDLRLPGRVTMGSRRRRVELVERMALDAKRSVALIRRDGREHLILVGPEGHVMIETGIIAQERTADPEPAQAAISADLSVLRGAFGRLVEKAGAAMPAPEARPDRSAETIDPPKPRREPAVSHAPTRTAEIIQLRPDTREAGVARDLKRPRNTTRWNRARVREALGG